MESFNALPALNLGALDAEILISLPVCGLRPVRAALLDTSNVPKPTSAFFSPFLSLNDSHFCDHRIFIISYP